MNSRIGPQEEFWATSSGTRRLFCRIWQPTSSPLGLVCVVHGLGEHGGRYGHIAHELRGRGMAVISFDLRGHGHSEGPRGDIRHYEELLDDVDTALAALWGRYPESPTVLYGHSMGGGLVANYCLERPQERVCAAVLSAPWFRLAVKPWQIQLVAARALSLVWPTFPLPARFREDSLSISPDFREKYRDDELIHHRISLRHFFAARAAGIHALRHAAEFKLPVYLLHSEDDRITCAAATKKFVRRAPAATWKLLQRVSHEVHHDPDWRAIYDPVFDWIVEHLRAKASLVAGT